MKSVFIFVIALTIVQQVTAAKISSEQPDRSLTNLLTSFKNLINSQNNQIKTNNYNTLISTYNNLLLRFTNLLRSLNRPIYPRICPLHEKYNECGSACPATCDNYKNPPQFCTKQCVIGCECEKGYVRNEADGSCCLPRECPATQVCPLNEKYNGCGSACPLTCDNYKSPPQFCTKQCVVGCECNDGYVRNQANGSCCLPSECPATQICPLNEKYNECGSACPETCDNYKNPQICTDQCVPGCECEDGYVRNEADGSCCFPTQCPATQVCKLNEVYNACGSACPATCKNYKNPPICTRECVPGCQCQSGYVKNEDDGSCCLPSQCPATQVCPLHEEYTTCGTACPLTCENYNNPPRVCTLQCVVGCRCQAGYVRNNKTGKCCLKSEC